LSLRANPTAFRRVLGWIAVGLSVAITSFWAYWGIIENFHEGWYHETLAANLGLMLAQYLSPMLGFIVLTMVALSWPRIGAALHAAAAAVAAWFFHGASNAGALLIALPLVGLGVLYWFGRPRPRRLARALAVGLPALTLVLAGTAPAVRVAHRFDDGRLEARLVKGNGISLVWAPAGPGWPEAGMDWHAARRTCQYLNNAGTELVGEPQRIWRLPTVDDVVRSMTRAGENSSGTWDAETARPAYTTPPDKESPLWAVHSQVIYWWTGTESDDARAYIVAYDGQVWTRTKDFGPAYLGFRCVRPPEPGAD
jgi:hypothetical protein